MRRPLTALATTCLALAALAGCADEAASDPTPPSMAGTFRATLNGSPWTADARFGPVTTFGEPPDNYTGRVQLQAERVDSSEYGPHSLVITLFYLDFAEGDVLPLRLPRDETGLGQGAEIYEGEGGNLVNSYHPVEAESGDVRIDEYDPGRGVLRATLHGTFAASFPGNGPHPGYTDTVRVADGVFALEAEAP